MKILKRGHIYVLDMLKPKGGLSDHGQQVGFVNKEPGQEEDGVTTQEILRMLIDRTHYCHNCLPHRVNEQIIWHFRMAIALHEARALEQKVAKGDLAGAIERQYVGPDGHLTLSGNGPPQELGEYTLKPIPPLGTFICDHRSHE